MSLLIFSAPLGRAAVAYDNSSMWTGVLDFLNEENDKEGLSQLTAKVVKERPYDLELDFKIITNDIKSKDRKALLAFVTGLRDSLGCQNPKTPKLPRAVSACDELARAWSGHLNSLMFFEESAQKIEQARRFLAAKDCPEALRVLKEVESKEGEAKRVLMLLGQTFECLGDETSRARNAERLREIKVFASELDS